MFKTAPHILVTGAGGSIAVNLTRSLKMTPEPLKLYGCDASDLFIHIAETTERAVIPSCTYEKEYVEAIRTLVKNWKIDLIIPSNMGEILMLARHRKDIGAQLFLPKVEAIEAGADKWKTHEILSKAGVDLPQTILIREPKDIDHAFAQMGETVWFRGSGVPGRGVGVASLPARSPEQARGWIDYHNAWGNMTAAEYLPGDNLTWMALWKDGELVASQARKRIAYVIPHVSPSGITGAPSVSCTVVNERVDDLGYRSMIALDERYNGVGFVDYKCDRKGNPKVTEVNVGRFGTTHHFYTVAGANFPYWYVQLAMGQMPVGAKPHNVLPPDLYWIRSLDAGPALVPRGELGQYGFVAKR